MFNENISVKDILSNTKIGLWQIEMDEGKSECMYADGTMLELLGLEEVPTPEECYRHWYNRIDKDYLGMVNEIIEVMALGQQGEVNYIWHHPNNEKIQFRFGGSCDLTSTQGIRFHGYCQNISEMMSLKKEEPSKSLEEDMFTEQVASMGTQKESLKTLEEDMLLSLQELYTCVMMLELDKNVIHPLKLTEEGEVLIAKNISAQETFQDMLQLYHPDDWEEIKKDISLENLQIQLSEGKEKFIREYRRKIQEGYHWVSITCYFMQKPSSNQKVLITIQDVDEQKSQEKEYQEYLKNRFDGNMKILQMCLKNENILEYFYYPQENKFVLPEKTANYYSCKTEYKISQEEFAKDLAQEEYCALFCRVHERIKKGEKSDYFYYTAKQNQSWCKCSISSVKFNIDGQTVFAVGIIEDLSKQRSIERRSKRF